MGFIFKWACTRRFDSQPTDVQGGPLYPWLQLMFVKWQQVTPGMLDCHIDLFTWPLQAFNGCSDLVIKLKPFIIAVIFCYIIMRLCWHASFNFIIALQGRSRGPLWIPTLKYPYPRCSKLSRWVHACNARDIILVLARHTLTRTRPPSTQNNLYIMFVLVIILSYFLVLFFFEYFWQLQSNSGVENLPQQVRPNLENACTSVPV